MLGVAMQDVISAGNRLGSWRCECVANNLMKEQSDLVESFSVGGIVPSRGFLPSKRYGLREARRLLQHLICKTEQQGWQR